MNLVAKRFKKLIRHSDRIIIMGHRNPDADSVGAGIGVMAVSNALGVQAYMVSDETCENSVEAFKSEWPGFFVTGGEASKMMTEKTAVVVVDTWRASITQCPELLEKARKIAVIDHHVKPVGHIENTSFLYHNSKAASTCEMVSGIARRLGVEICGIQATALYAGIYLDTRAFTATGASALEQAAYLKKMGADTERSKALFRMCFEDYKKKNHLAESAYFYKDGLVIAKTDDIFPQWLAAETADELIEIMEIETSFVIACGKGNTIISARSRGGVNVQTILEKMQGGGHITAAGVQLDGTSPDEAEKLLKTAIDNYLDEDKMRG